MWREKPWGRRWRKGRGGWLWSYRPNQSPKWSWGLMQCNSTPSHCSSLHPGHRAGLHPKRLLNPFTVCKCVCVSKRLPGPSFAHHCTNQPQRQQLQGAPLLTWTGEAVVLSKSRANTELSVLNRDREEPACPTPTASSIVSHSDKQNLQMNCLFIRRGWRF